MEVTLGRSIYFVMVSAFLQTIPQILGKLDWIFFKI